MCQSYNKLCVKKYNFNISAFVGSVVWIVYYCLDMNNFKTVVHLCKFETTSSHHYHNMMPLTTLWLLDTHIRHPCTFCDDLQIYLFNQPVCVVFCVFLCVCVCVCVVSNVLRYHIAFIFRVYRVQAVQPVREAGEDRGVWWSMWCRLGKIEVPTGGGVQGAHYPQLVLFIFGILTILHPSVALVGTSSCPPSAPHTCNYTPFQSAHIHPGPSLTFFSWLSNLLWPSPTGILYMSVPVSSVRPVFLDFFWAFKSPKPRGATNSVTHPRGPELSEHCCENRLCNTVHVCTCLQC